MLDLKAKLLAAGLVTAQQVKKVEEQEAASKRRADEHRQARDGQRRGGQNNKQHNEKDRGADDAAAWQRRIAALKTAPKGEQYETLRGWVLKHRIDQKLAVPSEAATRFHHQLVVIHPFPNGNGRHARLMTDCLIKQAGLMPFSWGSKMNLVAASDARHRYIGALRTADLGDIGPLMTFARS